MELSKSRLTWMHERTQHLARVTPWTSDRVERSLRGERHPVYDFLFEYYAFRAGHLERYSPGLGVLLLDAGSSELDWHHYTQKSEGAIIEPAAFPVRRLAAIRWGIGYLEATLQRAPVYHCFGLHEWAMVYRSENVRHRKVPLRLASSQLEQFVESQNLCCTHFDAFRFFTPAATPRNRHQLERASVTEFDQPGCIHVTMDLYKWSFHFAPFISSTLIADAFELAVKAREIDMRASPYDLQSLGFEPIAIETRAGREEYVICQRELYELAQPIRERLLGEYRLIEEKVKSLEMERASLKSLKSEPFEAAAILSL